MRDAAARRSLARRERQRQVPQQAVATAAGKRDRRVGVVRPFVQGRPMGGQLLADALDGGVARQGRVADRYLSLVVEDRAAHAGAAATATGHVEATSAAGARAEAIPQAHAQPGTLDPSFDPLDGADNTVSAMVTRADGSVVIGGQFTSFNGSPAGGIIQLLPSGQVDPGFVVGSGLNGPVMDMVLQPDGKLIVVGLFTTYDGVATGGGLVRLLSNGSIDPCLLYTSPSPRDRTRSRMPSSA